MPEKQNDIVSGESGKHDNKYERKYLFNLPELVLFFLVGCYGSVQLHFTYVIDADKYQQGAGGIESHRDYRVRHMSPAHRFRKRFNVFKHIAEQYREKISNCFSIDPDTEPGSTKIIENISNTKRTIKA